jgi:hypothetical protein
MSTEIVVEDKRSASLAPRPAPENHTLVAVMDRLAANPNLDADKIERLMNVFLDGQRKMAEMQDERSFAEAMADFKKNPPQIVKNRLANTGSYTYNFADLAAYTTAVMPALAERGITWSFPFSEKEGVITVSCVLRYGLYEQAPTTFSSPADASGGKNAIQAKASTLSYLERYTFCGATGMVAAMPDSDGKPTGTAALPDAERKEWVDKIGLAESEAELKRVYLDAQKKAMAIGDGASTKAFADAKVKRQEELRHGNS